MTKTPDAAPVAPPEALLARITAFVESDYKIASHRECHECGKKRTKEQLVADLASEAAVVQTFTGRVFCSPGCFADYKKGEGFR